ncbi:MAG: hypothetical protein R3C11_26510 [Planctomycetaceae bacterium]
MQISICDVTLWGLSHLSGSKLNSTSWSQLISSMDSLQVDSILVPDFLIEQVSETFDTLQFAQITFAVTEPGLLEERLERTAIGSYGLRFLKPGDLPDSEQFLAWKTARCEEFSCELDINTPSLNTQIQALSTQGVDQVILVDRTGSLLPHQVEKLLAPLQTIPADLIEIGCRFRHDMGVSVANSLIAVTSRVHNIDCSILGIGPFAGYTPLEEIATTLRIHAEQYGCSTRIKTEKLLEVNRMISDLTATSICPNKPVSGENIFATEAGIHQDGLLKNPDTYLPYRPELVGASGVQLVIGRHSGRRAVAHRLEELGHVPKDDQVLKVLELFIEITQG